MTWIPTESGRTIDLMAPDWREIDFAIDVPNALARIARFTGHIGCGPYSVAQHCVVGADAIFRATGNRGAAAAFVLHDAHEYVLSDKTTPVTRAEAETAESLAPGMGRVVLATNRLMKHRVDLAIFRAAGMGENGCPEQYRRIVGEYDVRLLATERNHFIGKTARPWDPAVEAAEPLRLVGKLTVWPWFKAADEYRERLRRYLPGRFGPVTVQPAPKSVSAKRSTRLTSYPEPSRSPL